jgi:hypothetical protein
MGSNESRYRRLTDNRSPNSLAKLDREELVGTGFAFVGDVDGETNFRLPIFPAPWMWA